MDIVSRPQYVTQLTDVGVIGASHIIAIMPVKSPWRRWVYDIAWWRHQMETFSALLAISTGNSPVTGEFPAQRPVTQSFDIFFDMRPNKRLSKQARRWWLETPSGPLWRHCNEYSENYWYYSSEKVNDYLFHWIYKILKCLNSDMKLLLGIIWQARIHSH